MNTSASEQVALREIVVRHLKGRNRRASPTLKKKSGDCLKPVSEVIDFGEIASGFRWQHQEPGRFLGIYKRGDFPRNSRQVFKMNAKT